jgi:hypothetical protein
MRATRTRETPWYVIPVAARWFRNLAVSQIIADAMADLTSPIRRCRLTFAEVRRKYHAAEQAADGGKKARSGGPGR